MKHSAVNTPCCDHDSRRPYGGSYAYRYLLVTVRTAGIRVHGVLSLYNWSEQWVRQDGAHENIIISHSETFTY